MKIFDKNLTIVSDNKSAITFKYGDKEHTIYKSGEFDPSTRYIYLGEKYYEDIPFHVSDGYAVCNGEYGTCNMVDLNGDVTDEDGGDNDVIEASFPKIKDILKNEELILEGLAYYIDLNAVADEDAFESYLESTWSKDVNAFFEGFFFFGGDIEWKVNGAVVED